VFSLTIPPIAEVDALALVPLAEVKSHLRIDGSEHDDDVKRILRDAIDTASAESGVVFGVRQGCVATMASFPAGQDALNLGVRPVGSVSGISYFSSDGSDKALTLSDVWASPAGLVFALGEEWPTDAREPGSVRVTFTAGGTVLPANARRAILLIVADWFENRGDEERKQPIPMAAKRLLFQLHSGGLAS
jgi:uncharacterized phiE125 gp8 family phage protein